MTASRPSGNRRLFWPWGKPVKLHLTPGLTTYLSQHTEMQELHQLNPPTAPLQFYSFLQIKLGQRQPLLHYLWLPVSTPRMCTLSRALRFCSFTHSLSYWSWGMVDMMIPLLRERRKGSTAPSEFTHSKTMVMGAWESRARTLTKTTADFLTFRSASKGIF